MFEASKEIDKLGLISNNFKENLYKISCYFIFNNLFLFAIFKFWFIESKKKQFNLNFDISFLKLAQREFYLLIILDWILVIFANSIYYS